MIGLTPKSLRYWIVISLVLVFGSFAPAQQDTTDIKLKAQEFLVRYEPDLAQTPDLYKQFHILRSLTPAAYYAGEIEKAKDYSAKLVAIAEKTKSQAGFGPSRMADAIHISNIVLGRIAFDDGNLEKAKEHLLAAGKIEKPSATLASFGPNMSLAKMLLEKGERAAVIQYLDLCAGFWKNEKGRLEKWKKTVNDGETPDFGASLLYDTDSWRFNE